MPESAATMAEGNWMESVSQVLEEARPIHKNTVVLSRVKKSTKKKVPQKVSLGFEIEGEKEEVVKKDPLVQEKLKAAKENRLQQRRKFEIFKTLRVKPDVRDRNRELTLKRVATKGVVQLFNAVLTQQKTLQKQVAAEKIDSKREDIMNNIDKKSFLNVLMGNAKSVLVDNPVKKEKEEKGDADVASTWSVLKDNFLQGISKKNTNWDAMDDDDEEEEDQPDKDDM